FLRCRLPASDRMWPPEKTEIALPFRLEGECTGPSTRPYQPYPHIRSWRSVEGQALCGPVSRLVAPVQWQRFRPEAEWSVSGGAETSAHAGEATWRAPKQKTRRHLAD